MIQISAESVRPRPSLTHSRFRMPFEHGAWWAFGSTWGGAVAIALARGSDPVACLATGMALAAGFVLQDWAQSALAALLHRPSQAASSWRAPEGWLLTLFAIFCVSTQMLRVTPATRWAWLGLWFCLGLAMVFGLAVRVLRGGRGRQVLASTALLLAAPALPLGALAFGFNGRTLTLAFWPLLYYPAATLAAQSYIRGFPERTRWAGPALAACLGVLAFFWGAWLAGLLLALNAGRWWVGIGRRWKFHPKGMPPIADIRSFGRTQAAFGVLLTLVWVWVFVRL